MLLGVRPQQLLAVTFLAAGVLCFLPVPEAQADDSWCNDSSGGVTCTTSWTHRRKITFNNSASSETLTDFPVLIQLSSSNIDFSKTQNSGQDIRFVDSADSTVALDHEVEKWDEGGDSALVWVRVPSLATGSADYIWMYYGNGSVSETENAAGVWDANFLGVWHLKETSGTNIADSTSSANDGTKTDSTHPAPAAAKIGGGQDFPDSGSISFGDIAAIDSASAVTGCAWVMPELSARHYYFSKNNGLNDGFRFYVDDSDGGSTYLHAIAIMDGADTDDVEIKGPNLSGASGTTAWACFTYLANNSTGVRMYINGSEVANSPDSTSGISSIDAGTTAFRIGAAGDGGNTFDGKMDEARLSLSVRSADWIEAEYLFMNDNSKYTYGSEGGQGIDISGTCDEFDQTTDCGDLGAISVAVNGSLQAQTDTGGGSGGTWTLETVAVSSGDVVTVFVDDAADSDEAVAVTKYDGADDITGMKLFKGHLTLGSADNQSLTNANLASYDNEASGDEDIFYESDTVSFTCDGVAGTTGLCMDQTGQSTQDRLHILSGNTFAPGGNVRTSLLDIRGTYTGAAGQTLTLNGSGTNTTCGNSSQMPLCVNGGTFTAPATVVYNGTTASNIHAATYVSLELKPGANTITFTPNAGSLTATGNLTVGDGSNTGTVDLNASDPTLDVDGDVTIAASGTLIASGSAAFTVGGSWTNNGAFTDSGGTVTFNSTSAGKTLNGQMTAAGDNFASVTFNGVGGQWTLAADIEITTALNITNGTFNQGATFSLNSDAITVASGGIWTNTGTGDVTLTGVGNVSNAGAITLDGSGSGCGDADAITISGGGAARNWSGAGTFTLNDLNVGDTGTTVRTALSSTEGSNNVWTIDSDCVAGTTCQ